MIRVLHTGLRLPKKREGIVLEHAPALVSQIINLDTKIVSDALANAEAMSFFSPRAVRSIFEQGISLPDIPIFIVGTKTQLALSESYGREAKRFENFNGFLSANISKKLVSFELRESRHTVSQIDENHIVFPCYETTGQSISISQIDDFDWIIITSPRGADSFFSQVSVDAFSGKFACLGKTTYEAMRNSHDVQAVFERVGSVSVDDLLDRIED